MGKPPWPVLDIYTVRTDASERKALTSDGHSHHPAWSPDGRRILFIHDAALQTKPPCKEMPGFETLHSVELSVIADGRNRRVLRVIEPVIHKAVWSPNGKMLAISAATSQPAGEQAKVDLYLLPASGQGKLRLLVSNAWLPSWSPDGKKLAFTVERPQGRWSIHVANADGTSSVRLTGPSSGEGSAVWSPDGQQLAFERLTEPGSRQQILLMNADGSNLRQVTKDPSWACSAPSWASGADQIVACCRSADHPCGMGIYSTRHPMAECTRRLFLLDVKTPNAKPVRITDHDAALPSYRHQ